LSISGARARTNSAVKFLVAIGATISLFCASLGAQSVAKEKPASLPPLGWSSWNSFSNTVNAQVVMEQARAMAANGMQKAGYEYVNIDEGWWLGQRNEKGDIVVDAKAWPALAPGEPDGDMSNIVRFIHGMGLKAGIYTDAGADGCGFYGPDLGPAFPHTGSEGHYEQDFLLFARWGFDYVKVDWCGGSHENLDPAVQYAEIARAIAAAETASGHRLFFSICDWGASSPWSWAPNIGGSPQNIWRTSGDIVDPIVANSKNSGRRAGFDKVLSNFDRGIHPEAQHTGFYNDPDMMVIGMPALSEQEDRVHMSLWAISGAPLLIGADLTRLTGATVATLTNPRVLAVDQDPLGLQAVKVAESAAGLEVWSKPLAASGQRAVLLLNRTASRAPIQVKWSQLGIDGARAARVTDLWSGRDLGAFDDAYTATVEAKDAAMLLIVGKETSSTLYDAPVRSQGSGADGAEKNDQVKFMGVASRSRVALIQIAYRNPQPAPRFAELRVNGQNATRIAFPPARNGEPKGRVWIQAVLDKSGAENSLTFSSSNASGLFIEHIVVE